MRFLIIFIFFISNVLASEIPNIKNIVIKYVYYNNISRTSVLIIKIYFLLLIKFYKVFMDKQNTYSKGDFCGHVAGPQGTKLLNKLKELANL